MNRSASDLSGAAEQDADRWPVRVAVQGFGYSGSGAVLDWLKDTCAVCVLPTKVQSFNHRGRGRIGGLLRHVGVHRPGPWLAELLEAEGLEEKRRIADRHLLVLAHSVRVWPWLALPQSGWSCVSRSLGLRPSGIHRSNAGNEGPAEWRIDLDWLRRFRERLDAGKAFDEIAHWQSWFQARVSQRCGNARWVVLDRGVDFPVGFERGWQAVYAPLRTVFVHRDPIDQLAEQIRQKGGARFRAGNGRDAYDEEAVGRFLGSVTRKLSRARDFCEREPDSFMAVPFEGFVREHAVWAARIADWAGFPDARREAPLRFDPAVSARNIGIAEQDAKLMEAVAVHRDRVDAIRDIRAALNACCLHG